MEYEDDFESQFAEELEMLKEQEESYGSCSPPSRRALSLASPFLPPGVSRKRPMEESPLPFIPSDIDDTPRPPVKVQRTQGSVRAASLSESAPDVASLTSARHLQERDSRSQIRTSETDGDMKEADDGCPYSPPSPYSLSSPTHSPSYDEQHSVGHSPKRRKRDSCHPSQDLTRAETRDSFTAPESQRNKMGSHWSSPMKTPSRSSSRAGDHLTPTPTPPSASRYKRALDPSQLEPGHTNTTPSRRDFLMDQFEDTYRALKSTPTGDVTSNTLSLKPSMDVDELYEDPHSPLTADPSSQSVSYSSMSSRLQRHSHVLTRAPPGLHVTVTSNDGTRVYLRVKSGSKFGGRGESSQQSMFSSSKFQLLSVPFARLRDSVEEERRRRLVEQSNSLLQSLRSDGLEDESQLLFGDSEDQDGVAMEDTRQRAEHVLWVDKYSPRHFTDLLSDDGINRTLLSWLKLWDECVFGRSSLPVGVMKGGQGKKGEEKGQMKGVKGKNFEKKVEYKDPSAFAVPEALDETRRPRVKIALLCGAPGLGKTTLAHIIAKHAGYNVVEMNASDDRSPELFHQRIQSATQMQAVLTADSRPNCLILDEIDGAPAAAINVLIELVKRNEIPKKKKKGGGGILSRPIICICNDQYASSLRQLKKHALVLSFPPTITSRLAGRLQQVAKKERMSAAMSTMMALCEKSDNDIRSCLNTLQFIHRNQKDLTLAAVQSASVGQKDAQKSLFSLWKEIFQLPSSKKRHTLNHGPLRLSSGVEGAQQTELNGKSAGAESYLSTNAARFYHILSATTATGEYEKVAQGLFENYLHIKFKDPNLKAISLAQDWTVFHDTLQHHISHAQDYLFFAYLPYLSVAFHFLFAAPSKPQIRYPHTSFEVFQRHQQSSHLLSSLMAEVPPHNRRTIGTTMLAVEILPPLMEIISPVFRPVSIQLYTAREKQQLADLVDTMISYNLTYQQERGADGQYTYVLDPNVEELCRFPGLPQRKQLTYSAKQLIAREVNVEKMRRAERALSGKSSEGSVTAVVLKKNTDKDHTGDTASVNKAQKQTKPVETKEEKPPIDFFGRVMNSKTSQTDTVRRPGCHSNAAIHPLWFRFNEGFSNAVRRPVRIQDLL